MKKRPCNLQMPLFYNLHPFTLHFLNAIAYSRSISFLHITYYALCFSLFSISDWKSWLRTVTRHFFCHSSLGHLLSAVIERPEQDDWRGKSWHILFICWGIFWWRKNVSVNALKLRRFLILSHFVEDLVSITCRGQGSFLFGFSHQGCSDLIWKESKCFY